MCCCQWRHPRSEGDGTPELQVWCSDQDGAWSAKTPQSLCCYQPRSGAGGGGTMASVGRGQGWRLGWGRRQGHSAISKPCPHSPHNTLYLELWCPAVAPSIIVTSDKGKTISSFGDIAVGETRLGPAAPHTPPTTGTQAFTPQPDASSHYRTPWHKEGLHPEHFPRGSGCILVHMQARWLAVKGGLRRGCGPALATSP